MNTTILIQLRPEELMQMIKEAISSAMAEQPLRRPSSLLSRQQVCERFGITLVTLNKWDKKGILPSVKLGNRRFYREADIELLIENGIKKWKKAYSGVTWK